MGQNLYNPTVAQLRTQAGNDLCLVKLLCGQLAAAESGQLPLCIPQPAGLMRRHGETHFHVKAEYNFQITGACRLLTFTGTCRIPTGTATILAHGLPHKAFAANPRGPFMMLAVEHHRPGNIAFILTQPDKGNLLTSTIYQHPTKSPAHLAGYLEDIAALRDFRRQSPHGKVIKGLVLAYLAGLLAELKNMPPVRDFDENWQIARCQDLVAAHLSETRLNVKMLAAIMKLSPDYLSHMFATQVGMTLTTYINHARINYAQKLLADSPLSVKEIAWAAGYTDPGYFTRVFRKMTGVTPKHHRA